MRIFWILWWGWICMFSRVRNSTIDVWMTSALGNLEKSNHFYQKTYGPVEWPTASRKFFFDILLLLDCWGRSKPCRILKFRWKNFTTSGKKNLWKSGKNRKTNPCSNKLEPIRNFFYEWNLFKFCTRVPHP